MTADEGWTDETFLAWCAELDIDPRPEIPAGHLPALRHDRLHLGDRTGVAVSALRPLCR